MCSALSVASPSGIDGRYGTFWTYSNQGAGNPILKYFDPELKYFKHPDLQYPGQLGPETYMDFIERITSNLDMEAIDQEYQIGHIEDCNYTH